MDDGIDSELALERSVACLALACGFAGSSNKFTAVSNEIFSFGYVAARICLWQLEHQTTEEGG
jgi:hypothetical protein